MKKTVSVLGCGWLGKSIAVNLLKNGFLVKGSTTTIEKLDELKKLNITPFLIDISINLNIDEFLKADVLIISITNKSVEDFKNFIAKVEKSPIKKIIFISTTSVYFLDNSVVTEKSNTLETPHLLIENLFRNNINFKTTIIRFGGLFGEKRHPSNWFKNGKAIKNPEGYVNLIHQIDCVNILKKIIDKDIYGDTFNACSDHHPKRREFYTRVNQNKGLESPEFEEEHLDNWKIISSEKLKNRLNYKFKVNDLFDI